MIQRAFASVALFGLILTSAAADPYQPAPDLTELSLAELANVEVTLVAKRPEQLLRTPAAVSVITPEEIRSAGATSIPDLLRFSAGVHVAQISSSQWAIGIRGFSSRLTRGQLALMDGRSLYTPLFAGTYWDVQDTLLDDVERIEVVRGPGGTLWGANAVNGVVNVVTRSSRDTLGALVVVGGGTEERAFAGVRHGGLIGASGSYRVYGKAFARDGAFHATGSEYDDWYMGQVGFRTDWDVESRDTLTLQGDLYGGRAGHRTSYASYTPPFSRVVDHDAPLHGGNVLARWERRLGGESSLAVLAYYDRTSRREASFNEVRDTVDVDFQHRLSLASHELVWGAGYRRSSGRTGGVESVVFDPRSRTDDLVSAFVQDELRFAGNRLRLTLGSKLEHNAYSGFEAQPTARLLWAIDERQSLWAAVTRAVRTPSRVDTDLLLDVPASPSEPTFVRVLGSRAFESERLFAYEAGYRTQLGERVLLDVATFYNRYPNLLSLEPGEPFVEAGRSILPLVIDNLLEARTYGVEVAADAQLGKGFTLHARYSYLDIEAEPAPGSADTTQAAIGGASPRHKAVLWGAASLGPDVDVFLGVRVVDELPSQEVDAYASLDGRVAWRATRAVELALVGRNLFGRHAEFGAGTIGATEIEPAVHGEVTCRW